VTASRLQTKTEKPGTVGVLKKAVLGSDPIRAALGDLAHL
jgi:hypothetical protein